MSTGLFSVLITALVAGGTPGIASGPQVGGSFPDLTIHGISGLQTGKDFALLGTIKDRTALIVIAQRPSREARSMLRTLDWYGGTLGSETLAAHVVFAEAPGLNREELRNDVEKAGKSVKLILPIGLLDAKNTAALKLHDKTALTILLVKDGKVTANFALLQPNDSDADRIIAATAKLLGKPLPTLKVTAEKENVVASRLEGTWQPNAELWKRLRGNDKPANGILSFKSNPTVAEKIPVKFHPFLEGKPIFMAGVMRRNDSEHPFLLTTLHGNPHVVYFRPRGGDPLGDAESFNLFIGVAKTMQNDLLFVGGDFNNQPFDAWERVK